MYQFSKGEKVQSTPYEMLFVTFNCVVLVVDKTTLKIQLTGTGRRFEYRHETNVRIYVIDFNNFTKHFCTHQI